MNRSDLMSLGSVMRGVHGGFVLATAGGTGDNTEYNGDWVSRKSATAGLSRGATLFILTDVTLTASQKLTILGNIQVATDSSGTGAADYGTAMTVRDFISATGRAVLQLDFNLIDAEGEYVRAQITPDLTAANTDTARIQMLWVFYGHPRDPIGGSVV